MGLQPAQLALLSPQELSIAWTDGSELRYRIKDLRDRCPCATCREKRNAPPAPPTLLPVLSAAETRPLTLLGMKPIGNYAYGLHFSDGHDTGIFTFELLREIGQASEGGRE